ncbi:unnamed protein product [Symbiodinium natans]|uniref:Uncharacterized protein n=1 Tax=Symbiodinium natans TaxID=878477 RepID=A0A812MM66_9DINO|nr:unnamed protein product [Symbiodinium natans]
MARACLVLLLCVVSLAHKVQRNVVLRSRLHGVVATQQKQQQLRLCNAYPYEAAIDVFQGKEKLTTDKQLPYRQCRDFDVSLKANDKLDIKIGNVTTGTFSVSEVPESTALLLLVVYRHDVESTAVSFESHMFMADDPNPQVAIIDAFLGTTEFRPIIYAGNLSETLRFGRVISLNPGDYTIRLQNDANVTQDVVPVRARKGDKYVVLRSGIQAQRGPSFQQELITYPEPEKDLLPSLKSSARSARASALLIPAIMIAFQQRLGGLALLAALLAPAQAMQLSPATPRKAFEAAPRNQMPQLRVCNAFPSSEPLSVAWRETILTGDEPLSYKACRDVPLSSAMKAGERLHIGLRNGPSNTFQLSDLPKSASLLLLVCFRQGKNSLDLQFRSHAFEPVQNESVPVAVLDTYDGPEKSEVRIGRDMEVNAGGGEQLWYDSVVSVSPGSYRLWLRSEDATKDDLRFAASTSSTYVVIRVGGEAHESSEGMEFPQELMIFPKSETSREPLRDRYAHQRSSTSSAGASLLIMCGAVMALLW